jgi:hypothetical protein
LDAGLELSMDTGAPLPKPVAREATQTNTPELAAVGDKPPVA